MSETNDLRLNRFLSRAGLGSRRGVEDLIINRRITLNGEIVEDLGRRVNPQNDTVTCDGRTVSLPDQWRVFAFHKPIGVVSSLRRFGDTPCLADVREAAGLSGGMVPVGRLDVDTSGLLIWTDDGLLAEQLMRPRHRIWKHYELTLNCPLSAADAARLRDSVVELDGRPCLPAKLEQRGDDDRDWDFAIREGRNRQIRRMFQEVGCRVIELRRVAVGPVKLDDLAPGEFRELTAPQIESLRKAVAEAQQ